MPKPLGTKKGTYIAGCVAKYLTTTGTSRSELAVKLYMCEKTLRNKLQNPDTFTRGELARLFKTLNFTDEERLECMK